MALVWGINLKDMEIIYDLKELPLNVQNDIKEIGQIWFGFAKVSETNIIVCTPFGDKIKEYKKGLLQQMFV